MAAAIGVDQAVPKRDPYFKRRRACVWSRVTPSTMPRGGPQARAVEETHASAPVEPPTRDQGVCSQGYVGF
jgi:hypothetical protein